MKKLLTFLIGLFAVSTISAQVFITEIADPNTGGAGARFVELYNAGGASVDLTGYTVEIFFNANTFPGTTNTLAGSIASNGFFILADNAGTFNTAFGFNPTQDGTVNSNGDDRFVLRDALGAVVDMFGDTLIDGTGTCHDFEDGRVERIATVTMGNTTWTESEWTVFSDGPIVGGCTSYTVDAQDPADFDPGVWIGAAASGCSIDLIALGAQTPCDPFTNTYTQEVTVTYTSAPASGTLLVNGQSFALGASPQTVILTGLTSDGIDVTIATSFSDDVTCTLDSPAMYTAPAACIVLPDIILNEYQADPAAGITGDANGDGTGSTTQDEFIELYNNEAIDVDISGWTISDDVFGTGALRHTFPAGTNFPAGTFFTIFGGGVPTGIADSSSVASTGGFSLNNGGDLILVEDAFGNDIISYAYPSSGTNQSYGRNPDFTGPFETHTTIVAAGRNFSPGALNVTPPSACAITMITAAAPSACAPATNTYTVDVTVTYNDEPASGTLDINGQSFAITTSPQTETLTALLADGLDVDVTAVFSADAGCTANELALFTAPVSCFVAPDVVINEYQADPDATNGDANGDGSVNTSQDEFIEFYNNSGMDIDISGWTVSDNSSVRHTFPSGTTFTDATYFTVFGGGTPTGIPDSSTTASSGSVGLGNSGDMITLHDDNGNVIVTLTFGAAGTNQSYGRNPDWTGAFETHSTIGGAGVLFSPGMTNQPAATGCTIDMITAGAPSACNPLTNDYSVAVTVTYTSDPGSGTLDVNGQSFAITTSPQTVTLLALAADGADVDVTAVFSDDGTCTATELALFTAPVSCLAPVPPCLELFFSKYVEGSGSNKCLEIYNPTATPIDMGAGLYDIALYSNGASAPTGVTAITAIVPPYGTYVICNGASAPAFQALADSVGGGYNATTFFNGDDAVALRKATIAIDVIGRIGEDPGTEWTGGGLSTANLTLARNQTVQAGDNNGADAFDPSIEWTNLGPDQFIGIGEHASACNLCLWTGIVSSDWNNAFNWSCLAVPTSLNDVVIQPIGVVNMPVLSSGANGLADDLAIQGAATLTIADGFNITLQGSLGSDATHDLGAGEIIFNGTVPQEIVGNFSMGKTTLDNATGLAFNTTLGASSLEVTEGIELAVGTFDGSLGTVTLKSTVAETAYLDDFSGTGSYTGSITQERFVTNGFASGLGQRYFGSSVAASAITGLDGTYAGGTGQLIADPASGCTGLMFGSPYSNLFEWEESGPFPASCDISGFYAISDASTLTPGRAYSGWMNNGSTLSVTGTPNTGATSYGPLANTVTGVASAEGWHLLSNPFPSPIAMSAVAADGFTSPQYYDASSGAYGGTFQAITPATNIPVMQGFAAETAGGSTWAPDNGDRVASSMAAWFAGEEWFAHKLDVIVEGNGFGDVTYVYFNDNMTASFDAYGDCVKRPSNAGQPTLSTKLNGENMSLNGFDLESLGQSIAMNLDAGTDGSFTFNFNGLESFPANTAIYVEDVLNGTFHNVANGAYTFTASVNDNAERFVIHFVPAVDVLTSNETCEGELGSISVDSASDSRTFEVIAVNGVVASGTLNELNESVNAGTYIVSIADDFGGVQTYTVEVEASTPIEAIFTASTLELEVGEVITLTNETEDVTNLVWTIGNDVLSNLDILTYSFDQIGAHTVSLAASNDLCSDERSAIVRVVEKTATSINDALIENVNVFANGNTLTIDLTGTTLEGKTTAEVYNLLGQVLSNNELNNQAINTMEISNATAGYYIVKIVNGQNMNSFKVFMTK